MDEAAKEARRKWERENYSKNRNKILAQKKSRRELNREEILEKERIYRQNNRDKIKGYNATYWQRRAEREAIKTDQNSFEANSNNFAVNIRNLREGRKFTQKQLAEMLGKKESTVRMWELDKNEPSLSTLVKLSKIFTVSLDEMIGVNE